MDTQTLKVWFKVGLNGCASSTTLNWNNHCFMELSLCKGNLFHKLPHTTKLVKIFIVACENALMQKWDKADPPSPNQWIQLYWTEKLDTCFQTAISPNAEKWDKLTLF